MINNGMPVTNMAQLQAMIAGQTPSPNPYMPLPTPMAQPMVPHQPVQYVTADQVSAMIQQHMQANQCPSPELVRLQTVFNQVGDLAKRALKEDDYKALQAYIANGAPGFAAMMGGDALYPIMEMLWETIRDSQK